MMYDIVSHSIDVKGVVSAVLCELVGGLGKHECVSIVANHYGAEASDIIVEVRK
jgi:hypothetical protein